MYLVCARLIVGLMLHDHLNFQTPSSKLVFPPLQPLKVQTMFLNSSTFSSSLRSNRLYEQLIKLFLSEAFERMGNNFSNGRTSRPRSSNALCSSTHLIFRPAHHPHHFLQRLLLGALFLMRKRLSRVCSVIDFPCGTFFISLFGLKTNEETKKVNSR